MTRPPKNKFPAASSSELPLEENLKLEELEISVKRREPPSDNTLAQILQQLEETRKENQQLKARLFALEQQPREPKGNLERREQNLSPPTERLATHIDPFLEGQQEINISEEQRFQERLQKGIQKLLGDSGKKFSNGFHYR
ncbi:hypothetical protein WN944_000987 [Citrus x changshan-huyou]|uniref:Uncharacterized protein n=1 Tax=Citrus x changshan-huyou TaxID=2935761 RepID=A0AAP0MFJ9_9ROSI